MVINAKRKYIWLNGKKVSFYGSADSYKRLQNAIGEYVLSNSVEKESLRQELTKARLKATSQDLSVLATGIFSKPYSWLFKQKFKYNRWKRTGKPFNYSL